MPSSPSSSESPTDVLSAEAAAAAVEAAAVARVPIPPGVRARQVERARIKGLTGADAARHVLEILHHIDCWDQGQSEVADFCRLVMDVGDGSRASGAIEVELRKRARMDGAYASLPGGGGRFRVPTMAPTRDDEAEEAEQDATADERAEQEDARYAKARAKARKQVLAAARRAVGRGQGGEDGGGGGEGGEDVALNTVT